MDSRLGSDLTTLKEKEMKKTIPTLVTNLSPLLDGGDTNCQAVYLQAASDNVGNIFFGRNGNVDFFLEPGKSSTYLTNNAKNLFVYSENGSEVLSFDLIQAPRPASHFS